MTARLRNAKWRVYSERTEILRNFMRDIKFLLWDSYLNSGMLDLQLLATSLPFLSRILRQDINMPSSWLA